MVFTCFEDNQTEFSIGLTHIAVASFAIPFVPCPTNAVFACLAETHPVGLVARNKANHHHHHRGREGRKLDR